MTSSQPETERVRFNKIAPAIIEIGVIADKVPEIIFAVNSRPLVPK